MLKVAEKTEAENIEKIKLDNEVIQIIYTSSNFKLRKNIKSILLFITDIEISNYNQTKILIKKLLKLQKLCIRRKIKMKTSVNGEEISCILISKNSDLINSKYYNELQTIINLSKFVSKKDRIEYVYDSACEYLDSECRRLNYCDFQNDVCQYKRNPTKGEPIKMGCCYHVKLFSISSKERKMCEYLNPKIGACSAKCFACKLFTCDGIKEKYKIKDIIYLDCFYNPVQKLILRVAILTPKQKIIRLLNICK